MDDKRVPVRVRAEVLAAAAYQQGKRPEREGLKLSSNENPFAPLPQVADAMRTVPVNRYAAPEMLELRTKLADLYATTAAHVRLAPGTAALLFHLVHTVAGPDDEVLFAWPSFELYPSLGLSSGARAVTVPLTADARHDLPAMAAAVTDRTRIILVCSPNNPTGPAVHHDEFVAFLERVPHDVMVVLDEAYAEFVTDPDAVVGVDLLRSHPNLVILRTFSKAYGLAGLRIGYGLADPAIWEAVLPVTIPLAVSGVAEVAALTCLDSAVQETVLDRVRVLCERRDRVVSGLRELGLEIPDAQGNFVWIPATQLPVHAVVDAFFERGTLVRPFPEQGVRITVAEEESVREIVDVITGLVHRSDTAGQQEPAASPQSSQEPTPSQEPVASPQPPASPEGA